MNESSKIIVLAIVLLIFLLLFVPKTHRPPRAEEDFVTSEPLAKRSYENFVTSEPLAKRSYENFAGRDRFNIRENAIADSLSTKSTLLYSNPLINNDTIYRTTYAGLTANSTSESLVMNRCIEFKKGGIDAVMAHIHNKGTFFLTNKVTMQYLTFNDIQKKIQSIIKTMHTESKADVPIFYGPIYVLITQYPLLRTIEADNGAKCTTTTTPLPYPDRMNNRNVYTPLIVDTTKTVNSESCTNEIAKANMDVLTCEFYILFPAHTKISGGQGIGPVIKGANWNIIRTNMKELLVSDPDVITTWSKEKQCFMKCGTISEDGYACAARNSKNSEPHESIVLNTLKNNNESTKMRDFANMYTFTTKVMNDLYKETILGDLESIDVLPVDAPPEKTVERVTRHNRRIDIADTYVVPLKSDRDTYDRLVPLANSLRANISTSVNNINDARTSASASLNRIENFVSTDASRLAAIKKKYQDVLIEHKNILANASIANSEYKSAVKNKEILHLVADVLGNPYYVAGAESSIAVAKKTSAQIKHFEDFSTYDEQAIAGIGKIDNDVNNLTKKIAEEAQRIAEEAQRIAEAKANAQRIAEAKAKADDEQAIAEKAKAIRASEVTVRLNTPFTFETDGKVWGIDGQNAMVLGSGTPLTLVFLEESGIFTDSAGPYIAIKDVQRNLYVRHAGYVLRLGAFVRTPNQLSYDFAWKVTNAGNGNVYLYNPFRNGHWVGYNDRNVLIRTIGLRLPIVIKYVPIVVSTVGALDSTIVNEPLARIMALPNAHQEGPWNSGPWNMRSFPDGNARWIWYTAGATRDAPYNGGPGETDRGTELVYVYDAASEIDVAMHIVIDNGCSLRVNGQIIHPNLQGGWPKALVVSNIKLLTGLNTIVAKVRNFGGPAGLLLTAIDTRSNRVIFSSNNEWRINNINMEIPILNTALMRARSSVVPTSIQSIPNLFAHYTPNSWQNNRWEDASGNGRHTIETRGSIRVDFSTDPSGRRIQALMGNTGAGVQFDTSVLPPQFTLFHLTRYTGGSRGRIFIGNRINWLDGHWAGRSGVSYHNEWITHPDPSRFGDNWVLSASQNGRYRANGQELNAGGRGGASTHITINFGNVWGNERSDWACAEVLVYNRHLNNTEIGAVESYLANKYNADSLLPITDTEAQCYLNRYGDLRNAFGSNNIASAKSHWYNHGIREGLTKSCANAVEAFVGATDSSSLYTSVVGAYAFFKLFKEYDGPMVRVYLGHFAPNIALMDIWFNEKGIPTRVRHANETGYSAITQNELKRATDMNTIYIHTWYDQSAGNKHIAQPTNSVTLQPRMIFRSDLNRFFANFNGTQFLRGPNLFASNQVANMHFVARVREFKHTHNIAIDFNSGGQRFFMHIPWVDRRWYWDPGEMNANRAHSGNTLTSVGQVVEVSAYKSAQNRHNGLTINGSFSTSNQKTFTAAECSGGIRLGSAHGWEGYIGDMQYLIVTKEMLSPNIVKGIFERLR
jgi:hypothetical protein